VVSEARYAGEESEKEAGSVNENVAWAIRDLEPALAAWWDILRGNPVRARQSLRKLVIGPVVMEPLPKVHGYRRRRNRKLNGGTVLEGTQNTVGAGGTDS
jgi:hypothetical protein